MACTKKPFSQNEEDLYIASVKKKAQNPKE
jgi:hypothetical protein